MFGKWFKKKSVPTNHGNMDPEGLEKLHYGKIFEVMLSNMEDSPVYPLTHQLTIGSEIGNIVIADPSISPRHATFTLQDEVVSLIDHGSVSGTFVSGKKIDAGKNIILQESDVVLVGDLEIRIVVRKEQVKAEDIPEVPEEKEEKEEKEETQKEEVQKVEEVSPPKEEKTTTTRRIEVKKTPVNIDEIKKSLEKKKKKSMALSAPVESANALVRVFAVLCDLLLSYSVLIIFSPFDEFREFLEFIPSEIATFLDLDWATLWEAFLSDYPILQEIFNDVGELISVTFKITSLLLVYIFNRVLTTFLFGVSLSEYLLGIRPDGNAIWARLGGIIRVLFGIVTWPFIIFDVTAVVSRRTLKEFMTFTNIKVPSAFVSILGILFYLPVVIVITALSPLVQGLEPPEAILINDRIEQKITKPNVPPAPVGEGAGTTAEVQIPVNPVVESVPVSDSSQMLNLELSYDPASTSIMPLLKFKGLKQKLNLQTGLIFYEKDLKRHVEVEILKTFDLKQLLAIGIKGNFFLYEKYPEIYNFVYEADGAQSAFRKNIDQKLNFKFANEIIEFTKTALSLGPDNVLEVMETQTPFIKGFVDYKHSLLALIEYKDFDSIGFMKIGNVIFMRLRFNKQKPFDLLIPLALGEGKILKVTYDKRENLTALYSKFYDSNLDRSDWLKRNVQKKSGDKMTTLEIFDFFNSENLKSLFQRPEKALSWYGYVFETSEMILKNGDTAELEIWRNQVTRFIELIEVMNPPKVEEGQENIKEKLLQNFRDIQNALDNNNVDYFGHSQTQSV